jgi:hypothetical protein
LVTSGSRCVSSGTQGFSVAGVLVLSIRIGANTAVFTVVYAVVLKLLAFAAADRVVSFTSGGPLSLSDVKDWRARSSACSTLIGRGAHGQVLFTHARRREATCGRRAKWNRLTGVVRRIFNEEK